MKKNKHKKYYHIQFIKRKGLTKEFYYIINLTMLLMIIIILFTLTLSKGNKQRNIKEFKSEINLTINAQSNSDINLLSNDFNINPFQVLVNGIVDSSCSKTCFLKKGINNITIKFEEQLESCKNMFKGLTNIKEIDLSNFDASKVKDMSYMFDGCSNLEKINFGKMKTNLVENMAFLFNDCKKLISIDISNFNTSSVTNMLQMFCYCENVKYINISSKFNTSRVENFQKWLDHCKELISIDVSNLDTSKVKSMHKMFYLCEKIKYWNLSHFKTSNVENMSWMFGYSVKLKYVDLSNFDTSHVIDFREMFNGCTGLIYMNMKNFIINNEATLFQDATKKVPNSVKICLNNVNTKNKLFNQNKISVCTDICFNNNIKIDLSQNQCVEKCDNKNRYEYDTFCYNNYIKLTSSGKGIKNILNNLFYLEPSEVWVNDIFQIFCKKSCYMGNSNNNNIIIRFEEKLQNCKNMFKSLTNIKEINLSNLDTSKVNDMSYMFDGCTSLEKINFGKIKTNLVENMESLFHNCVKLESIDLSNFDTSSVINMQKLFTHCDSLKSLDVSNFETSKVENMFDMFGYSYSLTSLNISNFDTSKVKTMQGMFIDLYNIVSLDVHLNTSSAKNMSYMFHNCCNLTSLDVSSFDTSSVSLMRNMFYNCSKLVSIDVSKFKTSNVENMYQLFAYCLLLTSINVSNFDTSKVTTMEKMFLHCESLKSLNVSNFNTSKVESMRDLFGYCTQLTSIDLSNFDTSNVESMRAIFIGASNLKFIDLSFFNTSKVNTVYDLFFKCTSLVYINLYSFKIKNTTTKIQVFKNVPNDTKICIEDIDNKNYLLGSDKTADCSDICFKQNTKIDLSQNKCVEYCNETKNIFEYNKFCYDKCPFGNQILINDIYTCQNDIPENYYLDTNDIIYKECYQSCKKCERKGDRLNHNCLECKKDLIFLNNSLYANNCYIKCPYFYYFDDLSNYNCSESFYCPENYNKLIIDKNQCIDECRNDDIYRYEYNSNCNIQCPNGTFSIINNKCIKNGTKEELHKDILNLLTKEMLILSKQKEWNDFYYSEKNILYTMTKTSNQKNNFGKGNLTYIDLGKCEAKLKQEYGIPLNDDLYILKIDVYLEGMKIPKVEYEVYYPLYGKNNLTKLDLSKCQGIKIDISIPIYISIDDLDKHNASSGYYNDICYTLTSETGTDKALKDRKDEFIENNMTVCEENCEFTRYNETQQKVTCSCFVKVKLPLLSEIKIDKNLLMSNFKDFKNIANIKMLKCLHLFLDKKNIFKNYANYLFVLLFIISFITVFIFSCCSYQKIKNKINEICAINKKEEQNNKTILTFNTNTMKKKKKTIYNENRINTIKNINNNHCINSKNKMIGKTLNKNNKKSNKINNNHNIINEPRCLKLKKPNNLINKKQKFNNINKNPNTIINIGKQVTMKKKNRKKNLINNNLYKNKTINNTNRNNNNITIYTDYELNDLEYEEAIKVDNRTYCQYYISLIRTKHLIVFSFFNNNDYNSKIVKIYLFFFDFAINYTISAMFYSETMMHQIYIESGAFNFIYQLPEIIYSAIITAVLNTIITTLGLCQDNVIKIKKSSKEKKSETMKEELNKIVIKIILFFIITYILLFSFWYYLGCFCAVYKNTQLHLLQEVSTSFASSLITPFFVNLLPGIFRIPALGKNKKRSCLYKFSQAIQIL